MQTQAAGLNHTPGTLFALPLLDFPAGFIKAFIDWELPRDRHQDDHYLHPAEPLVSWAEKLSQNLSFSTLSTLGPQYVMLVLMHFTTFILDSMSTWHGQQLIGPVPHLEVMVSLCAGQRSEAEAR